MTLPILACTEKPEA